MVVDYIIFRTNVRSVYEWEAVSEMVLTVDIKVFEEVIAIINLYGTSKHGVKEVKDRFLGRA